MTATVAAFVRTLARLYPCGVEPSAGLVRAVGYLEAGVEPEAVVRAGYGAGIVGGLVAALGATVAMPTDGPRAAPTAAAALAVGLGLAHGVHVTPLALARLRRTRALGSTTRLLGRAVLRMRIEPSPERAATFAARTGASPLARSLGEHVRRAEGSPETGFSGFVEEWGAWFPPLERAVALLVAGAAAPADERTRTLDRSLDAILDGTRDRMAAFAARIRGPATGLYAFGVLLPLALVGVLPAAGVAGVGVTTAQFALLYDVALPATLVAVGGRLLVRRPVAFPPPRIGRDHPDVPDRAWPAVAVGLCSAAVGWVGAEPLVEWSAPIVAVGVGAGAAFVVRYRPVKAVRDDVRAVESGLPDALYLVGRRVAEGAAVETALARASEEIPGATGTVLEDAVRVQRSLRVDVRSAFLGPYGALADVPSPRARGAAGLLALAATEGRPAGGVLVSMADQLEELGRVEREARRELAQVTGTLANTAALFAPLVGGATVALAARIERDGNGSGGLGGGALPTAELGIAVGAYVLLLAAILTALSVGLERGLDPALVGYRVGLALLTATATYLAAIVGAGALL
ncbi:type II secretion system protein [Halegenticoccus tardaugens]|uniref:type II secretion system protein n=1 Tax=Halegenticoccus tardaugens TaxID=2071624 RepID=UPI00100BFF85|nr:type II secretion system protein [Halegenticoccus tardaugens]